MPSDEKLESAVSAGIITDQQAKELGDFLQKEDLAGHEMAASADPAPAWAEKSAQKTVEDNEAPRFVRGFHDVLVTIGIAIGLFGIGRIVSPPWVLLAIWLFSEYFIQVQRLALPAVFLTLIWCLTAIWTVTEYLPWIVLLDDITAQDFALRLMILSALGAGCTGLFFLRFRTPLALAGFCICVSVACFGALSCAYLVATGWLFTDPGIWVVARLLPLISALGLFAVACWFDFSDPERITRRSDTAFWMHMASAPALIFTTLNAFDSPSEIIFLRPLWFSPSLVFPVLVVFMVIGVLLDRRAFVTSGLLSLAMSITYLVDHFEFGYDDVFSTSAISVSAIVLLVAVGWTPMRRVLLPLLPHALSRRLPPAGHKRRKRSVRGA